MILVRSSLTATRGEGGRWGTRGGPTGLVVPSRGGGTRGGGVIAGLIRFSGWESGRLGGSETVAPASKPVSVPLKELP